MTTKTSSLEDKVSTSDNNSTWLSIEDFLVGIYDWSAYYSPSHNGYKDAFEKKDFDAFIANLDSDQKCGSASEHMFQYVSDVGDYWQKPEETFARRTSDGKLMEGDCEDWSGVFVKGLKTSGKDVYLLVCWGTDTYGDESGHAICFDKDSNETICTFNRRVHGNSSVEDIAREWYPGLRGYELYRLKDDDTYERVESKVFTEVVVSEKFTAKDEFSHVLQGLLRFTNPQYLQESTHISIERLVKKAVYGLVEGEVLHGFGFDKELADDILRSYSKVSDAHTKSIIEISINNISKLV